MRWLNRIFDDGGKRLLLVGLLAYLATVGGYAACNAVSDERLRSDPSITEKVRGLADALAQLQAARKANGATSELVHDDGELRAILLYGERGRRSWRTIARAPTFLPYIPNVVLNKKAAMTAISSCDQAMAPGSDQLTPCQEELLVLSSHLDRAVDAIRGNPWYLTRRYINGSIQFTTVFMFWVGLLLLALHARTARLERKDVLALDQLCAPTSADLATRIDAAAAAALAGQLALKHSQDDAAARARSATRALLAIVRAFVSSQLVQDARAASAQQEQSLRDALDSRQAALRYAAWAIPSLGFIGTVVGIGRALDSAHQVVTTNGAAKYLQEGAIQGITGELGVAFDTTLVALLASLVLMLGIHLVGRLEEAWVERLGDTSNRLVERMSGTPLEELFKQILKQHTQVVNVSATQDVLVPVLKKALADHDRGQALKLIDGEA